MLTVLLLHAGGEEIPLRPLVEIAMPEVPVPAVFVRGDLAALRGVPKVVHVHVNVFGGLAEIQHFHRNEK